MWFILGGAAAVFVVLSYVQASRNSAPLRRRSRVVLPPKRSPAPDVTKGPP